MIIFMYLLILVIIILLIAYSITFYNYVFKEKEKTIEHFKVRQLLYSDGWKQESTSTSEFRGYYQFSKGTFVIHSSVDNYVLSNVIPNIHVIKNYSKIITESEVKNAIELVNSLNQSK